MKPYLLIGAALTLALGGCVSSSKPLRNAEGQVVNCKASGFGWLGAPVAMISQGECLHKLRKQGYYGFDEQPGETKVPSSAINYKSSVTLPLSDGWNAQALTENQRNRGIRILALNPTIDAGVMVSTIKRSAISDFRAYAETKRRAAMGVGAQPVVTEVQFSEEGGKTFARYQAKTTIDSSRLRYSYAVIDGADEITIAVVWATDANFDLVQPQLEQLIARLSGI